MTITPTPSIRHAHVNMMRTRECSVSPECGSGAPCWAQLWPQHSQQHWQRLHVLLWEAEHTIANRKSHLSSSAALSLWDTGGCCAPLRKVRGNGCRCGGLSLCFLSQFPNPNWLSKDTVSSRDCVQICKSRREGEGNEGETEGWEKDEALAPGKKEKKREL